MEILYTFKNNQSNKQSIIKKDKGKYIVDGWNWAIKEITEEFETLKKAFEIANKYIK